MNKDNDSRYWKFGVFYYNPEDPSEVVDRKNGKGVTINFAHKEGRRIFGFILIPAFIGIMIAVLIACLSKY
ncbi:DUF5808 domain-containing protein [Clostridium sp. 1001275B_160808_H3]|uniref:DUF5808 domain-containing protein n=1 Tax=Clostridium sp. 1001275B_160808_H3 TaxID=2787110 RepID=UPI00189A0944|nr:DUF5808 domain-containing protein [Clostridium sp. 1001275B_160808_H3]